MQKNAHLVDMEKCWKMNASIYLRRSASIQPRTSPKYEYEISLIHWYLDFLFFSPESLEGALSLLRHAAQVGHHLELHHGLGFASCLLLHDVDGTGNGVDRLRQVRVLDLVGGDILKLNPGSYPNILKLNIWTVSKIRLDRIQTFHTLIDFQIPTKAEFPVQVWI